MTEETEDLSVFDPLFSELRDAVKLGKDEHIAKAVKERIEGFIRTRTDEQLTLPSRFYQPDPKDPKKYGRRLLLKEEGLNVFIMTWAKGQNTPLHDHDKTWCVEGVLQGQIAVTRYDLEEGRNPQDIGNRPVNPIFSSRAVSAKICRGGARWRKKPQRMKRRPRVGSRWWWPGKRAD